MRILCSTLNIVCSLCLINFVSFSTEIQTQLFLLEFLINLMHIYRYRKFQSYLITEIMQVQIKMIFFTKAIYSLTHPPLSADRSLYLSLSLSLSFFLACGAIDDF